ncbi:hypothetical protein [Paraburkholderia susongensis]|uniref:hypothetical protein n=1 Tax=Paraburkholderia susongensis TaxID=1515439 RepID=UPI001ABF1E7F|nr:hypothetical protein [Paraburkholderia susongensis]
MKLLSLPTFFAAAKKVGAAPHRGNANKPIRKQGKANTAGTKKTSARPAKGQTPTPQQENKKRPTPQEQKKRAPAGAYNVFRPAVPSRKCPICSPI